MIELESDMEVCGEAEDIGQALKVIRDTAPDLVIVDVSMKSGMRSGNGVDLVARLREQECPVRMLVEFMPELTRQAALRAIGNG